MGFALSYHARRSGRHVRTHFGCPAALRSNSAWAGTWSGVSITSDFPSHIGYNGLAAITGDFNFNPSDLQQMQIWQAYGWISVQQLAHNRWFQDIIPTCKGATERDQIWLSPALAFVCTSVSIQPSFADHSTVRLAFLLQSFLAWPRPSEIPWDSWHHNAHCPLSRAPTTPHKHLPPLAAPSRPRFKAWSTWTMATLSYPTNVDAHSVPSPPPCSMSAKQADLAKSHSITTLSDIRSYSGSSNFAGFSRTCVASDPATTATMPPSTEPNCGAQFYEPRASPPISPIGGSPRTFRTA